ncbi:response regulator [bacterium]|nr:response regulator [bacterium]
MAKKLLVVDDEKNIRGILKEFMGAKGFQVLTSRDGNEAFEMFEAHSPDAVLADVLLPHLNGFQLCRRIRSESDRPDTPVFLMSALYKTNKIQAEAKFKHGATDYLLKPLDLSSTFKKILRSLDMSEEDLRRAADEEPYQDGPDSDFNPPPTKSAPPPAPVEPSPAEVKVPEPETEPAASESEPAPSSESPEALPDVPNAADFSGLSALQVFLGLYRGQRTGVIKTTQGEIVKKTYVAQGVPVYVASTRPEESLPALMVKDGVVTEEQVKQALVDAKENHEGIGRALLEKGVITREVLSQYLLKESERRLEDVLHWREGSFQFADTDAFLAKIKRPPLPLLELAYQHTRNGALDELFERRYARAGATVVAKVPERLPAIGEIDWDTKDLMITTHIDGQRTVEEVVRESGGDSTTAYRTIGLLEWAGVVRLA